MSKISGAKCSERLHWGMDVKAVFEQASQDLQAARYAAAAAQFEALLAEPLATLRVSVLHGLALAAHHLGRFDQTLWCYKALLKDAAFGERQPLLHQLGIAARNAGKLAEATAYLLQEHQLLSEHQTTQLAANHYERGWVAALTGNYHDASSYLKSAWQYGVAAGDLRVQAGAIQGLGDVAALQGDKVAARQYFKVSQKIFIKAGAVERALEVSRRLAVLIVVQ